MSRRKIAPDASTQIEIRNTVYKMYDDREHITLESLKNKLKEREIVHISVTGLWRILISLGFKYKTEDNRREEEIYGVSVLFILKT